MSWIFVDCESPYGVGAPSTGDMTEFGAVDFDSRKQFHGQGCSKEVFQSFWDWLKTIPTPWVFVSDNVAYDWQWINFYFHKYFGQNPLGFSGRRIGDFYAGLCGNFRQKQDWKGLRVATHDHNPVHDAMGNVEAFARILKGERGSSVRKTDKPKET